MYRLEQNGDDIDIILDGWEAGISDSPYAVTTQTAYGNITQTGIADMRNVNVITVPTEGSVQFKTQQVRQVPITTAAFSVAASNDTFTYSGTAVKVGTCIQLNTLVGGTGLSTATNYWVVAATATTFTVSASVSAAGGPGAVVNVTVDGTGTLSTVNMAVASQMVPNGANQYAIDINQRVWILNLGFQNNWIFLGNTPVGTNDYNSGIAIFNAYILAFYNERIFYCDAGASTASFTNWTGLTAGGTHRTFIDRNGTLYWCNSNRIGSLIQLTTFDPGTPATYSISQSALLIASYDTAQCIEQLGTNILIGGVFNTVYQWDRTSPGYTPIFIAENNTHRMVTVNTNTYIFAGNRGRIYVTNGANAELFKKVPDHLSGTIEPTFVWGGACYNKNQVYFSVSAFTSTAASPATGIANYGGIWAIDTNTNAMRVAYKLSYDTYGGYTNEIITVTGLSTGASTSGVTVPTLGILASWADSTESATPGYGTDITAVYALNAISNVPYSNYEAYIDTDMIPVGTILNKKTFKQVEFKLAVPLATNENVRLSYRTALSQSFTNITNGNFNTTNMESPFLSGVVTVDFETNQWLQIRVELSSTSSSPSYVRLKELRIRE